MPRSFQNLASATVRVCVPGAILRRAQVSRTAKAMVTQMGMSKKLGQVAWTSGGGPS